MLGARVPGEPAVPLGSMEEPTIRELVASLRSSFRQADFERVEKMLMRREESVAAAAESIFSEALALKEVEMVELESKCEALRKEAEGLRCRSAQLEERARKAEDGLRVLSAEQERGQRDAEVRGLVEARDAAVQEAERYKSLCRKVEEQVVKLEEEQKVASLREREALGRVDEMRKREQEAVKKILELEVENRELERARRKAEAEVADWKRKYGELEAVSLGLAEDNLSLKGDGQGMSRMMDRGTGSNLPAKQSRDGAREDPSKKSLQIPKLEVEDSDRKVDGAVRFGSGPMPAVIEIVDSDDEMETRDYGCLKQDITGTLGDHGDRSTKKSSNELHLELKDGAILAESNSCGENVISTSTPKRKRASRVITSDSDSEDDENKIPEEEAKRNRIDEDEDCASVNSSGDDAKQELMTPSRRRLVPLSQVKGRRVVISPRGSASKVLPSTSRNNGVARDKGTVFRKLQYPVDEDVRGHEVHESVESVASDSEGESLNGFIVNEVDDSDNECSASDAPEEEVSSGSSIDQIFAKIRREKRGAKWDFEADMLTSFGRDPVICMKAVCALYRQQTADEQLLKGTLFTNNRGFSKFDARRGSSIAEFLTEGNPEGPLTKSVNDLQKYDPTGVECCYKLATHYSKQLFMIYQNREDPYFLPT